MTKILYFEGAGMDFYGKEQTDYSDVGNFRIRTAFKNNDDIAYYIELGNCPRYNEKHKKISDFALRIDHLFKIEDRHKEELSLGGYEINVNHKELRQLDYTKKNITKWINENLNCSFSTIEVLDRFYGYRVHAGNSKYNLMDDFIVDHELAAKRRKLYKEVKDKYARILNRKYPAISIKEMTDKYIVFDNHQGRESLKKHGLPSRYEKIFIV